MGCRRKHFLFLSPVILRMLGIGQALPGERRVGQEQLRQTSREGAGKCLDGNTQTLSKASWAQKHNLRNLETPLHDCEEEDRFRERREIKKDNLKS